MKPTDVFDIVFSNLTLFISLTCFLCFLLYLGVRKVTIAGYFDPFHFTWTFTFGTAYSLVLGLYILGYIETYYFLLLLYSAMLFFIFFRFFISIRNDYFTKLFFASLKPIVGIRSVLLLVSFLYLIGVLYQINVIGFGALSSSNRFEQARGNGAVVRFLAAITPFMVAGFSILLYDLKSRSGYSLKFLFLSLLFVVFVIFNSLLDGSKIAILTYIFSSVLGLVLYKGVKPRFYPIRLLLIFFIVLASALLVQSVDLKNQRLDSSRAMYLPESYFHFERLIFRIIGNGDKYYLGLPDGVIDDIEIDNFSVRFLAPIVGSTNLSGILEYNVNDFNVGRQILLYHSPDRTVAGGPTSHFDLFSYKYFGWEFSWFWILITAFILSVFINSSKFSCGDSFNASLGAQAWISVQAILLEPPIGIAKVIDIFIVFLFIKIAFSLLASGMLNQRMSPNRY